MAALELSKELYVEYGAAFALAVSGETSRGLTRSPTIWKAASGRTPESDSVTCRRFAHVSHCTALFRYTSSSAVETARGRSGAIVSPRASMATSAEIFFARPAAVFMLLVRNASANRF
jgi:hypothetical protein